MATDNASTTSNLSQLMQTYYDRLMLDRLVAKLHYAQFATKKSIPKNSGKTVFYSRYTNFAANTTPLTEAVVPDGITLSATNVTATVSGYGDYAVLSDFVSLTAIDPVVEGAIELLAYRAAISLDTLLRNEVDTNGTVKYANDKTALSATAPADVFNAAEVRKSGRLLRATNVLPAVGDSYMCILHPNNAYDLTADTASGGWIDAHKYAQPENIFNGEIGKLMGMRFVESTNVAFTNTGISASTTGYVYNISIFGWNSFANIGLGGGNLKTYVKRGSESGVADPLEQKNTVGYKFYMAPKVLDATRHLIWKSGSAY